MEEHSGVKGLANTDYTSKDYKSQGSMLSHFLCAPFMNFIILWSNFLPHRQR